MRDISDYKKQYLNDYDFEKYMVAYRRKNIVDVMSAHSHWNILEIGCGIEPLFMYLDNEFEKYTVIEPSDTFYNNALILSQYRNNIEIIHGFLIEMLPKHSDQCTII